MNNARRKVLRAALELLSDLMDVIETEKDAEQEAYDNMPQGMQSGEKGEKAAQASDDLDSAYQALQEARDNIEQAVTA